MKNEIYMPHKSSIGGLDANLTALLCYIASAIVSWVPVVCYVAWLAPLVLFFMEKESALVKFHAMQSFLLHAVNAALSLLVSVVLGGILSASMYGAAGAYAAWGAAGIIGILTTVISIVFLVFAIFAMVGAYRYQETYLPVVGGIARTLADRIGQK
ncbi:MAG TPA: DUF4870 domain-containing protein [Oscillospiraceae bacterium]|nr:DUF4870 domain-containing protein [Oscillospiraceae bacterium]HNW05022.1 DUF4870 domain-containing protein [Oscillospiraceae bacterium]